MKRFFWGTLGLIAMAAPALAADLPVKAPPPVIPMFNWSGFYIGGNGGWARADDCWDLFVSIDVSEGCHDRSGGVIGGQIGYRWQQPGSHFVWGLEAQGDWGISTPRASAWSIQVLRLTPNLMPSEFSPASSVSLGIPGSGT
jgi:outer membrane immunogenic protein